MFSHYTKFPTKTIGDLVAFTSEMAHEIPADVIKAVVARISHKMVACSFLGCMLLIMWHLVQDGYLL